MVTEIIGLMVDTETNENFELMCTNRYCYVYKVLQLIPKDMSIICHNCGFDLEPWKGNGKVN